MKTTQAALVALLSTTALSETRKVTITVDASTSQGPLTPLNQFFGCDEPNYAYYPHGSELLASLGNLSSTQTFFRTHNLLTTGPGYPAIKFGSTNAYTEDAAGGAVYNWTIVDRIFDAYLGNGVKPYAQIGFMPEAMALNPEPYYFTFDPADTYNVIFTGWSHVPKDYQKYAELVYQWVSHTVARYGEDEVNSWYWETWNEPNIGYWNGTQAEFLKLNDYAIDAVRRALPTARVGGLEIAGGADGDYLSTFLHHAVNGTNYATNKTGTPVDFLSFHAKGLPVLVDAKSQTTVTTTATSPGATASAAAATGDTYIHMNVSAQLTQIDEAFGIIASTSPFEKVPIIISEYDPDGCAGCITPQYGYRNNLLYGSYMAESFVRAIDLAAVHNVNLQGLLTWAFEYENGFGDWFDGFRVLATQGVNKPILSAHRLLARVAGIRIQATSDGQVPLAEVVAKGVNGESSVGVLAALGVRGTDSKIASAGPGGGHAKPVLRVFVYNYHDNNLNYSAPSISLQLNNLPQTFMQPWTKQVKVTHYRLDDAHGNSYTTWLSMGSPKAPTESQLAVLKSAGELALLEEPRVVSLTGEAATGGRIWGWGWWQWGWGNQSGKGKGSVVVPPFELPIRGISLVEVEAA